MHAQREVLWIAVALGAVARLEFGVARCHGGFTIDVVAADSPVDWATGQAHAIDDVATSGYIEGHADRGRP
jgi:hypothetical protein